MKPNPNQVAVLVMFHDDDKSYKNKLLGHIKLMAHDNKAIKIWDRGNIRAGEEKDAIFKKKLKDAEIIVFMASPDSMASVPLRKQELKPALSRKKKEGIIFIPVLVRQFKWRVTVLKNFKILPEDDKPIEWNDWPSEDEPYTQIASAIYEHAKQIHEHKNNSNKQSGSVKVAPAFIKAERILQTSKRYEAMKQQFLAGQPSPRIFIFLKEHLNAMNRIRHHLPKITADAFRENILATEDVRNRARSIRALFEEGEYFEHGAIEACQKLEDYADSVKVKLASPHYFDNKYLGEAKVLLIKPLCKQIEAFEEKLEPIARSSINYSN